MSSGKPDAVFSARVDNWVRWCKSGAAAQQEHCRSIEHRYDSIHDDSRPTGWGDPPTPIPSGIVGKLRADIADAVFLNKVFVLLPSKVRRCIRLAYFKAHLKREWIARKLGVHHTRLEDTVYAAVVQFKRAVQDREIVEGFMRAQRSSMARVWRSTEDENL